jgi:signal transduction histidine kinase
VNPLHGRPKLLLGSLLGLGALGAILLGWHLLSLAQDMARQRQWAEDQVFARGRGLRQRLEASSFSPFTGGLLDQGFLHGPGATVDRVTLILGERCLWSVPPDSVPARGIGSPPASTDAVERVEGRWVYSFGLADGRVLQVSCGVPAYLRQSSRTALLALLEGALLVALLCLTGLLARRGLQPGGAWGTTEAGTAENSSSGGGGPSTQAVFALFQQTLKELRKRTEQLEEMHQRERGRAEDVERMAEALCANLEAGYLRFGEDGRLTGVNAAARTLLGLQEFPRLGDEAAVLLHGREGIARLLEDVRLSRALALRDEVPGASGVLLQVVAIPLFNLLHQLRGYLLILRDQTTVYQMRRTLREREALSRLGEVAAGVAHEVRNALSTFSARLRLLGQDVPTLASNTSFLALAEELRNLETVMRDLLFFARPLPAAPEGVDLADLIREERESLAARGEHPVLVLNTVGTRVHGDPEALARALRNLIRNALEAVASAPSKRQEIRLTCGLQNEWAILRVEDSGPGLSDEGLEHLFTPFYSQKPGGTGLGLAIARKVAREHGGDLVYFRSDLGGAAFELRLPCELPLER